MAQGHRIRDWILDFTPIGCEVINDCKYQVIDLPLLSTSSDGDSSVPVPRHCKIEQDTFLYRQRLADRYMEHFGKAESGKKYLFNDLPNGYFSVVRIRNVSRRVDRFLYGHPSKKRFRSPNQFWPHLLWLIECAVRKVAEYDKAMGIAAGDDFEEPEVSRTCDCQLCLA
ncbi:uncharacterized protein PV09_08528 [Verruconis gallopava]|uniref:Cryptic loci regulator 2 N-terminal domain-containing protein n=1 Tax=Verruconis gallopava TaxID=253628 RepID=A0A0D1XC66_9PEZI|nr:uncharacterized protein PV09_08528 [Verruconis gallopava]KIV99860.1 hypothetical protein PV09_08528 [Verruconis gallopava]